MASMMAAGPEVAPLSLPQKRNRVQPVQPLQLQTPKQKQKQKQKLKQIQTQIQGQNQSHLQTTLQPPPVPVSRYRTLRGKSVSSITRRRAFDVYNDGFGPINSNLTTGDCYPQLDSPTLSSPRVTRRRSKSVASLPTQRPKSPKASKAPKSPKVPKSPKLSKSPMLPKSSSSWPALPVLPALPSSPAPSWTPPPPPSRGPSPNPSSMLSSPVLPYDDPGVTVAAGGLADSVSGSLSSRLGGLVPRAAVGAVGHGPLPHRPASPSPASMDRLQAPSPVPPLPRPLALTPKPTAAPASAAPAPAAPSSAASSVLAPSRSREGLFNLRPKSKSKSKSRPKSKSKSSAPPIPSSPIPVPSSPVPSPVDEVARRKAFNLRSFRLNADTTGRAAQLERDNAERRRDEEQEAERWAAEVARLEAETDRIIAEQKKRDAARVRAKVNTPPPKLSKYLIFDKLPFLSRGRRSNATNSQNGTPSPKAPTVFSLEYNRASRASSLEDSLTSDEMSFIEQGGRGIVPNHDAPTSASNGGERVSPGNVMPSSPGTNDRQRVTVRCLSSTINLPVTPDTSPVDVLYSTANLTAHDIDPKTSVIVECYVDLGLERRLRRYERIRDVMNSWDRDQQNSLLVLTYDISENDADADLELNSVPRTPNPPTGFTLQLYHSSRPGKWNKRWITLLESGQMFSSKKPEAKASDKDSTVLCHLSDFDIYTPRESEVKRHLKAPRRFCYAVKSQQKTVVFPNGENFVHFFCAEDAQLAQRFHELVQRWRSWYLVTKQVDFEKKPKPYERVVPDKPPRISQSSFPTQKGNITKSISTVTNGSHRLKVSVDESPYTIGAFQPLMDLNRFDKPIEDFGKDFEVVPPPKPKPVVQKPKVQKPKILTKQGSRASHTPQTPQTGSEFSPGGLLGNGYEQKRMQAEQAERSERASNGSQIQTSGPFTDAPSLINSIVTSPVSPPREKKPEPRPWLPSASEHSARSRSKSVHSTQRVPMADNNVGAPNPGLAAIPSSLKQKPQPLVNLTNSFPEPPRWRESQGGAHRAPTSGGPLINFATGGPAATMSPIGPGLIRSSTRGGTLHNTSKAPLTGSVTLNSISTPPISSANILPRSRSSAGMPPPSFRAPPPSFRAPPPPVPPLPNRSVRREKTQPIEPPRGRDPRPREPLINRAGSSGLSSMSRY